MADAKMKVSQMGAVLAMDDDDLINVVTYNDQSQTYVSGKATGAKVKEYMVGDNDISALGDGSVTGAILNVKSTSETADSNIAETMAKNGAHNVGNNEAISSVQNTVTFTVNADKSITAVGTVTGSPENFYISKSTWSPCNLIKGATYIVSDGLEAPLSGYKTTFVISDGNQVLSFVEVNGVPQSITVPNNAAQILWYIGYEVGTVFNHTFKPMVKLASDPSTEYTPYAMTNRELMEKKLDLDSPDPLKEVFVESTVVSSMDMTSLTSIKAFLTDYTGANHLGTSIVNVRSGSNGQRATFIISNVNAYAMAIMVSFYNRDISSSCGLMAFYRAGNDWYSMPITGTWSPIA